MLIVFLVVPLLSASSVPHLPGPAPGHGQRIFGREGKELSTFLLSP